MLKITLLWYLNCLKKGLCLIHKREPYRLGNTQLNRDEAYWALIGIGYQTDRYVWEDTGPGISVRKLYGERQIHVRIFPDGQVRAHDELNAEFKESGHYNSETLTMPETEELVRIHEALKIEKTGNVLIWS